MLWFNVLAPLEKDRSYTYLGPILHLLRTDLIPTYGECWFSLLNMSKLPTGKVPPVPMMCSQWLFNLKEQTSHGRFQALELALTGPFCSTSYDLNFNPGIFIFFKKSYRVRCEYGQCLKRGSPAIWGGVGGLCWCAWLYFQLTSTYLFARGSTGSEATVTGDLIFPHFFRHFCGPSSKE